MVAMDIKVNSFHKFGNRKVYEDVLHILVNNGDNLDLNGRNLGALCGFALYAPHDVDKMSVGVLTYLVVVSWEAIDSCLYEMVVCGG